MSALDQILSSSDLNLNSIAGKVGLSPEQTQSAIGQLLPSVLAGFQHKASSGSIEPATKAVEDSSAADTDAGNAILGHIFGSKATSEAVAQGAASQTNGVAAQAMKVLLPIVAGLVAKHLANSDTSGGPAGVLGSLLAQVGSSSPDANLGSLIGAGENALRGLL